MNSSLKKNLTINHSTGKVSFTYKKWTDLVILPTFDNLTHIGKITRYFILYMCFDIKGRKIFGTSYFYFKDKNKNTYLTFFTTKEGNKHLLIADFTIGLIEYSCIVTILISIVKSIFN
jgi:hypothetical protein